LKLTRASLPSTVPGPSVSIISPSSSALPYVTGLGLFVTGAFNVKSQPVTFPDLVWIDAKLIEEH
jgi:hypothetical protein